MERLTKDDLNKVCYDPWEICGMDKHCTKGCHEEGGCTGGCHILKMHRKLAKYEDLEEQCVKDNLFGLHELCEKWKAFFEDIEELLTYHKKQEQGLIAQCTCEKCIHHNCYDCSVGTIYCTELGTYRSINDSCNKAEAEEALAKMGGK